ncbi:MAG: type V CRISPR-associated protein Cas12a/Cpf1 [Synergistaceae bacterium]|nr:type V CRISPR-associated protein Cas12a/Cpf1 [Acholeplasmataceae bacterium]MDD3672945.1 type V CRISPR-associated protein Cas12a/Cpf1 [Synergistaceae bacterium]MDD4469199.1 type V CRISPR-associated protein Cas12a/Cpf1 [Acholeplasmataceae bacterium]
MAMSHISDFSGLYPLSKTLRFELKPIGDTLKNIKASGILEEDHQRRKDYEIVKKVIDDLHREFIHSTLAQVNINWKHLAEAILSGDDKLLEKEQEKKRKELINYFDEQPDNEKLFSKELFTELLPKMLDKQKELPPEEKTEKLRAIKAFDKFSTYFKGFHENRKNMYSDEKKSTSITYRTVDQNFPKFLSNIRAFEFIKENAPSIIEQTEEELSELLEGHRLNDIFCLDYFNKVLTQKGISFYNTIIGGLAGEAGAKSVRGINQFSNLHKQKNPEFSKTKQAKMVPLFKQILSDRVTFSFIPKSIEDDKELIGIVTELLDSLKENDVMKKLQEFFGQNNISSLAFEKIWVSESEISNISSLLFGSWETISKSLFAKKENEIGSAEIEKNRKKIEVYLKSKSFSLNEIDDALSFNMESLPEDKQTLRMVDYLKSFDLIHKNITDNTKEFSLLQGDVALNLAENEEQSTLVKRLMDSLILVVRFLKPFTNIERMEIDTDFYSEILPIYEQSMPILTIYNAARNYITRKPYSTAKFKLNFKNPTLLDGWDKNKEQDNTSIILIKDGMYYLGVMNAKNKLKAEELDGDGNKDVFMKMNYKLLPGPNKMLPKVFFSKKGLETFDPPESILRGYQKGLHKKGDSFDRRYCHKLIDYFKEAIQQHPDWSQFGFNFSDTSSYEDISGFYREVESQGYKLTFTTLSDEKVNKWVKEGRLYLFKIWNKDFAPGSTGKPNLHTLYWKQLFDEKNLSNVVFKLNGEAELFYREKSIEKPVLHGKGSLKVNKRDIDGRPIEEETYNEILLFANGKKKREALGESARSLIDNQKVRISEFKFDIVKDRRFTEDKFAFHVPITINFSTFGNPRINSEVNLFLKNNPEIKIIGIDRGERHLIYLSLIDRKGNIIEQRTFNSVNEMDYHEKLDQMEKARDKARKSWQTIGKIKEMKEGYLSQVIHEIACMMVKNNAIVVMEDLNFGFKRGRFKVEKQVYQKFEKMLIDKLNFLAFKDREPEEKGGLLKGLQLTEKFESFEKLGKQSGFLFYVPAAYTSKIDPTTGFSNLFNFSELSSKERQKEFLLNFDAIRYDSKCDCFIFDFDYGKFKTFQTSFVNKWSVFSHGERIRNFRNKSNKWEIKRTLPTDEIKKKLIEGKINFGNGHNILEDLGHMDKKLSSDIFYIFRDIMQMRNSDPKTGDDYIISPVMNSSGAFFDSRKSEGYLPCDADANGAYHIALKGIYMLNAIDEKLKPDGRIDYKSMMVGNKEWFEFVQSAPFRD